MAIAPLPDAELLDVLTETRPALRLLSFPGECSRGADPGLRMPLPSRRGWSEARKARLRRTGLVGLTVGLLGALALPVSALAGTSVPKLVPGTSYTVRTGDTLSSIARRLDPSDPGPLVGRMAAATGSRTVVVGEHIVLP